MVGAFLLMVLQVKKADRERYEKTRDDWENIHKLQKEHIGTLETRVVSLQGELDGVRVTLARVEQRADTWNRRNATLYEQVEHLRDRLRELDQDPGPPANGG